MKKIRFSFFRTLSMVMNVRLFLSLFCLSTLLFSNGCAYSLVHQLMEKDKDKDTTPTVSSGKSPSTPKVAASTPPSTLHEAADRGDIEAVKSFIRGGADVNCLDRENRTPLQRAVAAGHVGSVILFLDRGADVNTTQSTYYPPLLINAQTNHRMNNQEINIARLLISQGANVNIRGDNGRTPLHFAASYNHVQLATMLLANGANVNAKENFSGYTPLHMAAEGVIIYDRRQGPGRMEIPDMIKLLLNHGADFNEQDKQGNTPLHKASESLGLFAMDRLLGRGADVNAVNHLGWTPLHKAARGWGISGREGKGHEFCNPEAVRFLIARGANARSKNKEGQTWKNVRRECNENKEPDTVRSRRAYWKKVNKPKRMKRLVLGSPMEDVITMVGPFHDFKRKTIYQNGRPMHAVIWRYWLNGKCHRLFFEKKPPKTRTLSIAGVGGSHDITYQENNIIEGGRLVRYECDGKRISLSSANRR